MVGESREEPQEGWSGWSSPDEYMTETGLRHESQAHVFQRDVPSPTPVPRDVSPRSASQNGTERNDSRETSCVRDTRRERMRRSRRRRQLRLMAHGFSQSLASFLDDDSDIMIKDDYPWFQGSKASFFDFDAVGLTGRLARVS